MLYLQNHNAYIGYQSFVAKFSNGKTIYGRPTDARAKYPRVETSSANTVEKLFNRETYKDWLGLISDSRSITIGFLAIVIESDSPIELVSEFYCSIVSDYKEVFEQP